MKDAINVADSLAKGTLIITSLGEAQTVLKALAGLVLDQQRRIQQLEGPRRPGLRRHELSRPVLDEAGKLPVPLA